jgi:hypothetical protein
VDAREEGDLELRPDSVGATDEHGVVDSGGHGAEAGKAAHVGEDLWDTRRS